MTPLAKLSDPELLQALREADSALPEPPAALLSTVLALWPPAAVAVAGPAPGVGSPATSPPAASRLEAAPPMTPERTARASTADRWRTRIAAFLSFDSWAVPTLAHGMRSAAAAPRHLLYTAEGRDLDLRLGATPTGWVLTGQVLGPDTEGEIAATDLDRPDRPPRRAPLDALGEFRLDALSAGHWSLALETGDGVRVELPPLRIDEPPA